MHTFTSPPVATLPDPTNGDMTGSAGARASAKAPRTDAVENRAESPGQKGQIITTLPATAPLDGRSRSLLAELPATGHALSCDELLAKVVVRRREAEAFDRFLRLRTSWETAPASTRFHLAEEGGLLRHSVGVANVLLRLREALAPEVTEESCVIVGLYHDLGKVGAPGVPYYLPRTAATRNPDATYTVNPELVHLDVPTRSLLTLAQHLPLTDEEAQAVRYHDGQYVAENRSVAHRECPLTLLLQFADTWCGQIIEGG